MLDIQVGSCIYIVKGTLNQLSYEISELNKSTLDTVEVELNPDWGLIRNRINSINPFGYHTYIIVNAEEVPVDLDISLTYTLIVYVSDYFTGEVRNKCKKIFKSCHKPYFSIDLSKVNYIDIFRSKLSNLNLGRDLIKLINNNPKTVDTNDIESVYFFNGAEESSLIDSIYKGDLSLWKQPNRYIFYKYILDIGSKYNYKIKDKPFFNLPMQLYIFFKIYSKYRLKDFKSPEHFLKLFFTWVYLTSKSRSDNIPNGLIPFVNNTTKATHYMFCSNVEDVNLFNKLIRFRYR